MLCILGLNFVCYICTCFKVKHCICPLENFCWWDPALREGKLLPWRGKDLETAPAPAGSGEGVELPHSHCEGES